MKNVFITPLESSIWFYLIQKRSSLDFLNFHFLSFLQIYYKSGISHQAISPSLFFFKIKAFFPKFFIQNPFDVSNFERIKEDDLSKIPDENSGWDAEFWEKNLLLPALNGYLSQEFILIVNSKEFYLKTSFSHFNYK